MEKDKEEKGGETYRQMKKDAGFSDTDKDLTNKNSPYHSRNPSNVTDVKAGEEETVDKSIIVKATDKPEEKPEGEEGEGDEVDKALDKGKNALLKAKEAKGKFNDLMSKKSALLGGIGEEVVIYDETPARPNIIQLQINKIEEKRQRLIDMITEKEEEMIESVKVKEEQTNEDISKVKSKIEENENKILETAGSDSEIVELKKHIEELKHDITDLEKLLDKDVLEIQ